MNENNKTFYFFIGTIAELIKIFPLIKKFKENNVEFKIIASGQNDLSCGTILKNIGINKVDIELSKGIKEKSALNLLKWFFVVFLKNIPVLKTEFQHKAKDITYIIVHGDTVSTVMGSLFAKFFHLKLIHVEAGLRSFNFINPFPEEIDRLITSNLSDISFCPNEWAMNNLKDKKMEKINTKFNTLIDSLNIAVNSQIDSGLLGILKNAKYFIFVLHRNENLVQKKLIEYLINKISSLASDDLKCLFILHPVTEEVLGKLGIIDRLQNNKNIILSQRLDYFEMMKLLDGCEFILTDGGSNQEECFYLGKPCCVIRKKTERIEGLNENVILYNGNLKLVDDFVDHYISFKRKKIDFELSPTAIIFDYLVNK